MDDEELDENDDGAGVEWNPTADEIPGGVDAEREDEPGEAGRKPNRNVDARQVTGIENRVQPEITNPELTAQVIATLMQMGVSESYSGMLPKPDDFNKYPLNIQERMCRWNDAFTIDESKRQNDLVNAEIEQARKGMWVSTFLFLVAMIFALVAFILTKSSWSFGFLAVPVVSIVANLFEPIASRSSRDKKKPGNVSGNADQGQAGAGGK